MFGYIAGGALIGGAAGIAGASIGTAAAAGASGLEAAMAGGMMGGISAGAINGGGMTALAGGSFNDVFAGFTQGAVIGGFAGFAGGAAFAGMEKAISSITLESLNPAMKFILNASIGKDPLHNTISYMAGSTASQMTANLLTGNQLFKDVDFGINPGIIYPLFADIGIRNRKIRSYKLKKEYNSSNGSEFINASPAAPYTELKDNGDLSMLSYYTTQEFAPEVTVQRLFWEKTIPAHSYYKHSNYAEPVLFHNYRGLIQTLLGLF